MGSFVLPLYFWIAASSAMRLVLFVWDGASPAIGQVTMHECTVRPWSCGLESPSLLHGIVESAWQTLRRHFRGLGCGPDDGSVPLPRSNENSLGNCAAMPKVFLLTKRLPKGQQDG
jgi:hypothetical protein